MSSEAFPSTSTLSQTLERRPQGSSGPLGSPGHSSQGSGSAAASPLGSPGPGYSSSHKASAVTDLPPERRRSGLPPLHINVPTSGPEYSAVFYKNTSSVYGTRQSAKNLMPPKNGLSNRFSKQTATGGMWRNYSLNNAMDKERFHDLAHEWLHKL